jgi:methylmalonyl-CoA/ethylmalonyl-CoA epimerase
MAPTVNHIGVAVPSIAEFLEQNRVLYEGFSKGPLIENTRQGVNEMFMTDGAITLELLEPAHAASPIAGFLKRNRAGGLIHIALEVDDLEGILRNVEAAGGKTIVDPIADVAFQERRIAFVVLNGHVTELIERKRGAR